MNYLMNYMHLLQIVISRLKADIRDELKLIYIKEMEQLWLKSWVEEGKLVFFQRLPWSHSEDPSSNFTPSYKGTPPPNIEDEKNWFFRCHAPNYRLGHKCKGKQLYMCEIESDNDNDKDSKYSNEESKQYSHQNNNASRTKHLKEGCLVV